MKRRLTEAEKAAVLSDYAIGMSVRKIATKHGVAFTYPSNLAAKVGAQMRWPIEKRREYSERARKYAL
jgi:hypothetical protein